jgi:hypothetical protein
MLNSKRLEDYLRLTSHHSDYGLVPKSASRIRVSNIKKLSEGMTNNTYSFLLTFTDQGSEQSFDLILKGYTENVSLWFKIYNPYENFRPYAREFQVLRSLARVGFPVPPAYLCECDSFYLGYPFLVMRKEKVRSERANLNHFAGTLARLHNLEVNQLGITAVKSPEDSSVFARERLMCLNQLLNETRHYKDIKKDFNYALNWLESNVADKTCPKYCLVHGEYHPGHTLLTNDNRLEVIDWESAQIGDPAFDVGYAYHLVRLMYGGKDSNSREKVADEFVSEYSKNFHGDLHGRLEFYKIVGILGVAIVVSSWISNPVKAYRCFGQKAFARALAFPFLRSQLLVKKWLNEDFLISYLQYCQDFIETNLR